MDSPILLDGIKFFPKLGMHSIFITIVRIFLTEIHLSKQRRPWWDAASFGVSSGSTLFTKVFLLDARHKWVKGYGNSNELLKEHYTVCILCMLFQKRPILIFLNTFSRTDAIHINSDTSFRVFVAWTQKRKLRVAMPAATTYSESIMFDIYICYREKHSFFGLSRCCWLEDLTTFCWKIRAYFWEDRVWCVGLLKCRPILAGADSTVLDVWSSIIDKSIDLTLF